MPFGSQPIFPKARSGEVKMNYFKVVNGSLCPAPECIKKLFGSPTRRQYLFFGYKPVADDIDNIDSENCTYVEEETFIRRINACENRS